MGFSDNGPGVPVHVLLDDGSQLSYITGKLQNRLKSIKPIKIKKKPIKIKKIKIKRQKTIKIKRLEHLWPPDKTQECSVVL